MHKQEKAKKKVAGMMIAVFLVFSFTVPMKADASGLPGFSGYPSFTPIPCICSGTIWSFFAPLWLSIVPMAGPMVYVPYATVPYPYFAVTIPATSHVGAYVPGVQACWQYVGLACVPMPAVGVMLYTGTGVPGASI